MYDCEGKVLLLSRAIYGVDKSKRRQKFTVTIRFTPGGNHQTAFITMKKPLGFMYSLVVC